MNGLYILQSGAGRPAWNMALDEALFEASARLGRPVLRFYSWAAPAATFGYFQKYAEAAGWTGLRPLIRRPTGGGLVPHDGDWTYSLIFPPDHAWHHLKAAESYERLHQWIQQAFALSKLNAQLAPDKRGQPPRQCFAAPEQFDLVVNDRKIAGAAQRRNRLGLLIQGSIQAPPGRVTRAAWEENMRLAGERLGWINQLYEIDDGIRRRAEELEALKYSQADYNEKR